MRKLSILAILTVTAAPTIALAAPPACKELLTDWFTQVKMVDTMNKTLPAAQQMPLPDLPVSATDGHLDCLKDDVLVINGDAMVNMKPLVTCSTGKYCAENPTTSCTMDAPGICTCNVMKPNPGDCKLDYGLATQRAMELMGGQGAWDELVIFGQQISASSNPAAPLFYRDGFVAGGTMTTTDPMTGMMMTVTTPPKPGVNEVGGIGLDMMPRVMGHPYVGYIAAGGTNQAAKFGDGGTDGWMKKLKKDDFTGAIGSFGACGKAPKLPTDQPQDQPAAGLCFPSFYNFFDALAQASAAIYGPYLKGPIDSKTMQPAALSVSALIGSGNAYSSVKGAFVTPQTMPDPMDPTKKVPMLDPMTMKQIVLPTTSFLPANPRFWNGLIDTQGSLFAGNTYRYDGNGTYETTKPSAFYGINIPFPAGWKAGTVLSGSQVLRFMPLDLYAMGLMSKDELLNTPQLAKNSMTNKTQLKAFIAMSAGSIYRDGRANPPTGFDKVAGPQMGQRTGLVVRPGGADSSAWIQVNDILTANGDRAPAFETAPHAIKQLWVVVSKPQAFIEQDPKDNNDLLMKRAQGLQHLDVVGSWRHQFAAYYYMLTQYRGRVVNTTDGSDDNAYFEFGQPSDDKMAFAADPGVTVEQNGWESASSSGPDMKTVLRFTSVPGNAGVSYTGKQPALRIVGSPSASKVPVNSVSVRMRVPVSAGGALKGATASLTIGGDTVQIPPSPAALVADGAWHNYVAPLSSDGFKGGTFDSFSFSPSNKPYDGEGIEVEFIRVANVPSLKDSDKFGARCPCNNKELTPAAKKACTMACVGKDDNDLVVVDLADGIIDTEDNCPTVYNPDQIDSNGDGVGDACEDFDADGVVNAWDNCPTVTNSRQVDKNHNGIGDVCDGSQSTPCFLAPDSLGGPVSSGPGALLGALLTGSVAALVIRRRRRR
jgi:hypothetical protein